MKRFFTALALCSSLLLVLAIWLFPIAQAKEDPIIALLNLPAPPPPNPWVRTPAGSHSPEFYDKESPPPDDAPIEDLMDYWSRQSGGYQELGYNPKPSDRAFNRIIREIQKEPNRVSEFLNILQDDKQGTDLVRDVYRQMSAGGSDEERELRKSLKRWLTTNSDEFAEELVKTASEVKDTGEYVTNQDALLNLTRVDWDQAEPIVNRLYSDGTQKVSKVLATWALYRNALRTGGSDVDRYRDELKAVVEDKSAGSGARDLALDALVKEKNWSGRDEWYYSLLEDETLHDLQVNGQTYTGLTTIMYYTSDEGHVGKMIELTGSDNIAVRSAAVKNLVLRLNRMSDLDRNKDLRAEIARALLPWFRDPKWVKEDPSGKQAVIRMLATVKLPEAVPALIAALDETDISNTFAYAANAANYVARAVNSANSASAAYNTNVAYTAASTLVYNPFRSQAISALEKQADPRAVPALRRVLTQVQEYERAGVVKALLACNGFTTDEQVAAVEFVARNAGDAIADEAPDQGDYDYSTAKGRAQSAVRLAMAAQRTKVAPEQVEPEEADTEFESYGETAEPDDAANRYAVPTDYTEPPQRPMTGEEFNYTLGAQIVSTENPSEDLVRGIVARIDDYDKRDPVTAGSLRKILLAWNGAAVNALLLRDLKAGRVDADAIVKLLAVRKKLRETQMSDVADARNGGPAAQGIVPCVLEDIGSMEAVLDSGSDGAKTALLACARLIRAHLIVPKVAANLRSSNKLLALAAERYLESEDSPEARGIILGLYPNQAKILGSTTSFQVDGMAAAAGKALTEVFASVSPYYSAETYAYSTFYYDGSFIETEKRLQKEVLLNPELVGVYAYDENFIHIYKDRAVFSWSDDPARYRERVLEQNEWDNMKGYLAHFDVDKLPPFLACTGECDSRELLMLSKAGGRRVFVKSSSNSVPEFFAGLDKIFDDMRQRPAKLKYFAASAIPGLEVHFADGRLAAQTVWKEGADVRILVTDDDRSKAVESEIAKQQDEAEESLEDGMDNSEHYQKFYKMRESRKYESYGWFQLAGEQLAGQAAQPAASEFIPAKDGFSPSAESGRWKAKTATWEIRADETGLYKIASGRVVRIRTGYYGDPVITANGRWVIATKYSDDSGNGLVRVNLLNNREFRIESADHSPARPVAYIQSINRVLLTGYGEEDHGEYENENYNPSAYDDGRGYYFLNPDTGIVTNSVGEVRPIAQQTFRGLQPTGAPGDFWAAIPRGTAGTLVGIYSTRTFTFRPMLKLPKLIFDSTAMWVDGAAGRVWFTYQGHVLSAPIK